jgi:hypothetical protein
MAVLGITQWRIRPGKMAEFIENCAKAKAIQERLGVQSVRIFAATFAGPNANVVSYVIEHADAAAQGAFTDKLGTDPEWQDFWQGVNNADPSADMLSNAAAVEIPLG